MDIALRGTRAAPSTSASTSTSASGTGTGSGLHHAVSLGNIGVSAKAQYSSHMDRSYDSEDEHMGRRRLRQTLSTELQPRTSVYSRGDIREQYCLTDRQLHSIEQRPRRERFFGCLSRRGQTQGSSFLGGCVGRRVPSDENLAAYAPFEKYPRYQNNYTDTHELDSSYFRRQPASILSTGKSTEPDLGARYTWIGQQTQTNNNSSEYQTESSSYHCPTYATMPATHQQQQQQQQAGNPRTKHVSFARSHTLTSFDTVNAGFRSSGRLKSARSQERLIGGKKPIIATGSMYETLQPMMPHQQQPQQQQQQPQQSSTLPKAWAIQAPLQLQTCQHHPIHLHQPLPDNVLGLIIPQPLPMTLPPPSPEVLIVEKKFRNAMKTQATQTEIAARREGLSNSQMLALSPRAPHRIKVMSQGAQTNGLQNGKKLTKSLSEIPNGKELTYQHYQQGSAYPQDLIYRTQSQDVTPLQTISDAQNNIMYYKPPPPLLDAHSYGLGMEHLNRGRTEQNVEYVNVNAAAMALNESFDYESNSLPRRACTSHARTETDYYSNSLPRRPDALHSHDVCKHITECAELMTDSVPLDFTLPHLLPPPSEYCKNDEDVVEEYHDDEEEEDVRAHETESYSSEMCMEQAVAAAAQNRRMSMMAVDDSPFRRDDLRRQSMPVYGQTEKLIDGFGPRTSFRRRDKVSCFADEPSPRETEQEIFIDFKPHVSPKPSPKQQLKHRKQHKAEIAMRKMQQQRLAQAAALTLPKLKQQPVEIEARKVELEPSDDEEDEDEEEDEPEELAQHSYHDPAMDQEHPDDDEPLYENVTPCSCKMEPIPDQILDKRAQFRKRSVSLDDDYAAMTAACPPPGLRLPSTPASPCREELLLANVSTYPSSDSLANDNTRDHSDGIWNESQVTVLTAEQRDISDGSYSSNLLLTPSSKRKNLLLQHQQRSSVDTDALDFEDQSPTYGLQTLPKIIRTPTPTKATTKPKDAILHPIITPAIAVTPSSNQLPDMICSPLPKRSMVSRGSVPDARQLMYVTGVPKQRHSDASFLPSSGGDYARSADISECSTNTDEYATCTDTSKRTPVSTQSSQLEKTHAGSSFESASSLYSMREDLLQHDEKEKQDKQEKHSIKSNQLKSPIGSLAELAKKSPSHSISSTTSSGSCQISGQAIKSPAGECQPQTVPSVASGQMKVSATETTAPQKPKPESISEDERSEVRYSSSGYYESPHEEDDEEQVTPSCKARRQRQEDERKRRKTSMKLDIEKENMRALTSPVKKPTAAGNVQSPEQNSAGISIDSGSPSKMKRFRPKIRRQLRKSSREDVLAAAAARRARTTSTIYGLSSASGDTELLLDASMSGSMGPKVTTTAPAPATTTATTTTSASSTGTTTLQEQEALSNVRKPYSCATPTALLSPKLAVSVPLLPATKSASEAGQLKAKSIESLRSVSPGSDSVFYSEADGNAASADQGHCLHCGKEKEGKQHNNTASELAGDSVESIPYIEQEADIVKPPSDFADSPVTTKTTQRLYKKMDKRFRSEERYHGERGRHYKTRQENIRAKSEERGRAPSLPNTPILRPAGSSPCVLPDIDKEQSQHIIYKGHYDEGRYTRLTDDDLWTQLDHQCFDRSRERRASTESEKGFHAKYQVILHRLVQRRCTLEMYHRQKHNNFRVDKTVVVKSDSGEFGFRIHGSKPVVVAAIEPETPAESSGLEVGDIIISVNGVQVLDKHHTEVVKIAHDGCEKLELQVARTIGVLMHEQLEPPSQPIFSGYLWRQSGQAKGAPNTKKWVRRWFSLRPDNCLYYYKTEDDSQPVGAMIMAKHTVDVCPLDIGKPFAFKVDSGEGIPMYVAADSEELVNRWLNLLRQAATQDNQWLDKSARCLYQSPGSILRPDCFGHLLKLGSRWCGWSKRYCVLKDACLYFYQDANSKSAFGMACLHGYKVASMSANASGKKNSFEIIPPEAKLRHYYFCTESEMDKKRWISALEYSIDRWIKSG